MKKIRIERERERERESESDGWWKTKQNKNKTRTRYSLGEEGSARFSWHKGGEVVPVWRRHFDTISDLLFSSADLPTLTIRNFSVRQRLRSAAVTGCTLKDLPVDLILKRPLVNKSQRIWNISLSKSKKPNKSMQERTYNRGSKRLAPLSRGQAVRIRHRGIWEQGTIERQEGGKGRSYVVQLTTEGFLQEKLPRHSCSEVRSTNKSISRGR